MIHSNLDISQCQVHSPAHRKDLLVSDPVWAKLRSLGESCEAVAESGTQRTPSRVPPAPGQSSHTNCPEDEWILSLENFLTIAFFFFLPRGVKSTEGNLEEVMQCLQCKIPYLHCCLLVSDSEFFILQLPTKTDRLQCCFLSIILCQTKILTHTV